MNFSSNCCRAARRSPETEPDFFIYAVFATSIALATASRNRSGDALPLQAQIEKGKRIDSGFLQDPRA